MSTAVLITGVSDYLGWKLAARLGGDPLVERVIGVDSTPPSEAQRFRLGRCEFVRADIRNQLGQRRSVWR